MAVITLGGITLPGDLYWEDEFQWSPVIRTTGWGLSGAPITQVAVKQSGRPITLVAQNGVLGYVWLDRATLIALKALSEAPTWAGTLTFADGRTFAVIFREDGLTAESVIPHAAESEPALAAQPYTFTLKLQTTA